MLSIDCPFCGPHDEHEFRCGGESHVVRPVGEAVTDAEWAQYLFYHDNPKGLVAERWCHVLGCRQWFNVVRDTVTHEILRVYRIGDPKPLLDRS